MSDEARPAFSGSGWNPEIGRVPADCPWKEIASAPRDGTHVVGSDGQSGHQRQTWWGKASHIGWHGWCFGDDVEEINIWHPTHWKPKVPG